MAFLLKESFSINNYDFKYLAEFLKV